MLLTTLCTFLLAAAPQGNPAKDIKSKDFQTRLTAIDALAAGGEDKAASKLLVAALKDDDWEVVEAAIVGLGEIGGVGVDRKLLDLALDAPARRHRLAASRSLARAFGDKGWIALEKKIGSKTAARAAEAAASFGVLAGKVELKSLEKLAGSDEEDERRVASVALLVLDGDRLARITVLWPTADAWTRSAMLKALLEFPDASLTDYLLEQLANPDITDVVQRRLIWVLAQPEMKVAASLEQAIKSGASIAGQARRMRLLAECVRDGLVDSADAMNWLKAGSEAARPPARAAAAHALVTLAEKGGEKVVDEAVSLLLEWIETEQDRQARGTAVRSIAKIRDARDDAVANALAKVATDDASPRTREDAVVALGVKDQPLAIEPLLKAIDDEEWTVRVVAAVSLGMTQSDEAVARLTEMVKDSDWRMRGAAVIGLQRSYRKPAVPPIIDALEDEDATVRKTALETLIRISKQTYPAEREPWLSWWSQVERAIQLYDPEEVEARREKYGYGDVNRDTATLFDGFDVVVVQSRGDHIENVLGKLEIQHRLTAQSKLPEAELHPHAACVVNCTGEILRSDAERIAWFVRTGGYLLGSCWSLTHTIQFVYPGVIRKLPTRGEVLDDVLAEPCAPDSPYLSGVFPEGCEPRYALEGAHLIQITDPERVEVLVDSPECAATWGEGNLAAWFPAGHGLILDSVNHFEEQGLMRATHLKKTEERQAYAIDHMGLRYDELRPIVNEKFWKKNSQAAAEVLDLSVFRIVSNFVREKRIAADS